MPSFSRDAGQDHASGRRRFDVGRREPGMDRGRWAFLTAKVTSMAIRASIAASPASGGEAMNARMSKVRGSLPRYRPKIASRSGKLPKSV